MVRPRVRSGSINGPDIAEMELPKFPREQAFAVLLACLKRANKGHFADLNQ
jgi:hypothetical protein